MSPSKCLTLLAAARLVTDNLKTSQHCVAKSRLQGKIAIVTASTTGIGYAIARRLAQESAKVIISSRKQENVDSAVSQLASEGLDVIGLPCQVTKAEDRKKLFNEAEKLGGVDILISNAALSPKYCPVLECEEGVWDKIFETNVKASLLLSKEVLPLMQKRENGRIIYISSIAAYQFIALSRFLGAYSVSKTALLGLTKAVANELADKNVTVNCIAPGLVETKFSEIITKSSIFEEALKQIQMGRIAVPEEISGIAAFLASDDASYITGECIVAAGGMTSHL